MSWMVGDGYLIKGEKQGNDLISWVHTAGSGDGIHGLFLVVKRCHSKSYCRRDKLPVRKNHNQNNNC